MGIHSRKLVAFCWNLLLSKQVSEMYNLELQFIFVSPFIDLYHMCADGQLLFGVIEA